MSTPTYVKDAPSTVQQIEGVLHRIATAITPPAWRDPNSPEHVALDNSWAALWWAVSARVARWQGKPMPPPPKLRVVKS